MEYNINDLGFKKGENKKVAIIDEQGNPVIIEEFLPIFTTIFEQNDVDTNQKTIGLNIDDINAMLDYANEHFIMVDGKQYVRTDLEKWEENNVYKIGDVVNYYEQQYRCIQEHTSNMVNIPTVQALWELV